MYTLNAVKLRNELNKLRSGLKIELKNVRINGTLQGCSGFVTDETTGVVVYVSTDRNHGTVSKALYRLARHNKDYTGYGNHFAAWDDLAAEVVAMLDRNTSMEPFAVVQAAMDAGRLKIVHVTL